MVVFIRFRSIFWPNCLSRFTWCWICWFFWVTRFHRYWFCFLAARLTIRILEVDSCFVWYQLVLISFQIAIRFEFSWNIQLDFFETFQSSEIFHFHSDCISLNTCFKGTICITTIHIGYWRISDCQDRFECICDCELFVLINIFWQSCIDIIHVWCVVFHIQVVQGTINLLRNFWFWFFWNDYRNFIRIFV